MICHSIDTNGCVEDACKMTSLPETGTNAHVAMIRETPGARKMASVFQRRNFTSTSLCDAIVGALNRKFDGEAERLDSRKVHFCKNKK